MRRPDLRIDGERTVARSRARVLQLDTWSIELIPTGQILPNMIL
jgi:hypothetical protein